MGLNYSYKSSDIAHAVGTINSILYDARDMKLDGYVQFGAKQDLYRLKWILDDALSKCPTFSIEDEWLKEQEQKKIIKILSNDI
jgi:hypothetical protein